MPAHTPGQTRAKGEATPGPWTYITDPLGWELVADGKGFTIGTIDCSEADIELIASAPQLAADNAHLTVELAALRKDSQTVSDCFATFIDEVEGRAGAPKSFIHYAYIAHSDFTRKAGLHPQPQELTRYRCVQYPPCDGWVVKYGTLCGAHAQPVKRTPDAERQRFQEQHRDDAFSARVRAAQAEHALDKPVKAGG